MKAINTTSWNGTGFYFDQWNGTCVQQDKADLSSLNFSCDESDLESARQIAEQEGLTSSAIQLTEIDLQEQ